MSNSPFRKEVFAEKQVAYLGQITLIRPLSFSILTFFFISAMVIAGVFLCLGKYTNSAKVEGTVVPEKGMIKIHSTQSGTITEMRVVEGQAVHKGDVLCILSSERANSSSKDITSVIAQQLVLRQNSFRTELEEQESIASHQAVDLGVKISSIKDELLQLESEIALQEQRIVMSEDVVKKYKELEAAKFSPSLQTKQKEDDLPGLSHQIS